MNSPIEGAINTAVSIRNTETTIHTEGILQSHEFINWNNQYQIIIMQLKELNLESAKRIKEVTDLIELPGDKFPHGSCNKNGLLELIGILKQRNPAEHKINRLEAQVNQAALLKDQLQTHDGDKEIYYAWESKLKKIYASLWKIYVSKIVFEIDSLIKKQVELFQKLYNRYPYENFSHEDKSALAQYGIDISLINQQIAKSANWIMLPLCGPRIPEELNHLTFHIGNQYHVKRLELELGINPISNSFSELIFGLDINEKINSEHKELINAFKNNEKFEIKKDTLLFKEYKIHLMPLPEKTFECTSFLLEKIFKNDEIKKHLSSMKFLADPNFESEDPLLQIPRIVIYPKLGKEHAQAVLDFVFEIFSPLLNEYASHQLPRYNVAGANGLVYYAQGDAIRKIKIIAENPEVAAKIYSSDYSLFKSQGEISYALNQPIGY